MFGMFGPPKPMSEIMFGKFDTDNSGSIDTKEFNRLCFSLGYALAPVELNLAVKILDDDGSGRIELNEFKKWWARSDRWADIKLEGAELEKRKNAADLFMRYDPSNTGFIQNKDYEHFWADLNAQGLVTQPKEKFLESFDASGDGRLSFSEFIDLLQRIGAITTAH